MNKVCTLLRPALEKKIQNNKISAKKTWKPEAKTTYSFTFSGMFTQYIFNASIFLKCTLILPNLHLFS